MPVAQPSKEYQALCHVHHVKMSLHQILLNNDGEGGQILAYVCTEPDCPVRYNILCGYFLVSQGGDTDELQMVPRVRCPQDGVCMYLGGINPEKRSFRLWECPLCGGKRTNEEGLVGRAL
jgi:hypothetical protein